MRRPGPLLALVGVTAIWGVTFVQVQDALELYPLFAFLAIRFTISTVVLAPFAIGPLLRLPRQGFLVGVTNPKTIVFFVAALPQFVDFHAGYVPLQMIVLGLVFTLVALVFDSLWALLAGSARQWFARSPRRLSAVRATGGGMMIGLGAFLLVWSEKPATA